MAVSMKGRIGVSGRMLAVLSGVLWALGTPALQAAPVRLGNVVSGGSMITKEIQSIQERKYAGLIRQERDFSCGAAALATIFRYAYGAERATEQAVLEGLFRVSDLEEVRRRGFSLLNMKNYVEALGMRARGYRVSKDKLGTIAIPTIVLLDLRGYKHFVVLKKVTAEHAYIADPALGNEVMGRKKFVESWNGVIFAVIGPGLDRETALLKPRQPLSARRLQNTFAPVPTQQLLEFGFRHAELF